MNKKCPKVVLFSRLYEEGFRYLSDKAEMIPAYKNAIDDDDPILDEADAILIGNQKISGDLIRKHSNIKVIAKQGSGFDNVDVGTATECGIPVVLSAGVNAASVAEHVMMMILAASRRVSQYDRAVRNGDFSIRSTAQEKEISGKNIGLIGYGRIGKAVGNYARAMGMKVGVYDAFIRPEQVETEGFHYYQSLEELLKDSDVISIHVPLTDLTRGMIGKEEISRMKDNAVLVNCSRGNIVDEDALADALKTGKLFGAGVDVFASEPVKKDNPLLGLENVVLTPHSAALTEESTRTMSILTAKGLWEVLQGNRWDTVADPAVF